MNNSDKRMIIRDWLYGVLGIPTNIRSCNGLRELIDGYLENGESIITSDLKLDSVNCKVKVILTDNDKNFKNIDVPITVDIDTELVLDKINELKKETGALDLSVNRERIKKFEEGV